VTAHVEDTPAAISLRELLIVLALAIALTVVFWWPLWAGGGLIGGDTYSYFFPQKQFLSESLHSGEFPLWNNRTGFGYPLIAESQTGALYPPHLLLYGLLDVNTAYNANQLLHYVLAFVFTWLLARSLGLTTWGSVFAALVYVYGWFPPRMCLEWAIIGGAWLPLALFLVEKFLRSRLWLWLAGLGIVLCVQMLAGHFHLAFITQILLVGWVPLRLFFWTDHVDASLLQRRAVACGHVVLAMCLGFGLASAQLLPTLELKQISQRETADGEDFDPGYGHIPPLYLSQVVASWWFWYDGEIDRNRALAQLDTLAISSGTNETEAHLYFGLAALTLMGFALFSTEFRPTIWNRHSVVWLIIGGAALVYAVGWLLPVGQHAPGFGFFRGPGRYGILATLGVALVAGRILSALLRASAGKSTIILAVSVLILCCISQLFAIPEMWKWLTPLLILATVLTGWARLRPSRRRGLVGLVVFLATTAELYVVAQQLAVAVMVRQPVIARAPYSQIGKFLQRYPGKARLYAPGPNLPNLLGVSSVPEYLGIGPAPYYNPNLRAPKLEFVTPKFIDWARNAGVTHILSFEPLFREDGTAQPGLVFAKPDAFLNPAWGRGDFELLYLYKTGRLSRVTFADPKPGQSIQITSYRANSVTLSAETPQPSTLVLTDLDYPGWTVTIDGERAESKTHAGQFRSVVVPAGKHIVRWEFHSASFQTGAIISLISLLLVVVIAASTLRSSSPEDHSAIV
jgi:hypothetical protein